MIKLLFSILVLSIVIIQPVSAQTMQLKQWIAPPECVIDGNILTPEECDKLLSPVPPVTEPPATSTSIDTPSQNTTSSYRQVASFLVPSALSRPSLVNETGIRIVDRAETRSSSREYSVANLIILSLIFTGAILLAFTAHRRSAFLSKEDKFDKLSRRVSSFWTRKAK